MKTCEHKDKLMYSIKLNFGIIIKLKFAMNELPRTVTSVVAF